MRNLCFVKPSAWRILWSVLAATFAVYVIAVVGVYILGLTTSDSPKPARPGHYLDFLMWDLLFAGPAFVFLLWFISVPLIIIVLLACLRRASAESTAKNRLSTD